MPTPVTHKRPRRFNFLKPRFSFKSISFYFITLAALALIYFRLEEIQDIRSIFAHSDIFWLTIIVILQFFSFVFTAFNYRDVLRIKGFGLSIRELLPVTFVVQFLNQALPSATVSGQVFFVSYLNTRHRLPIVQGISRAILEIATLYAGFGVLFISSMILLLNPHIFQNHWEVRLLVYLFVFLVISFLLIFNVIQSKERGKLIQWFSNKIEGYFEKKDNHHESSEHANNLKLIFEQIKKTLDLKELRQHGWLFAMAIVWQLAVLFTDMATMYVVPYALGDHISLPIVFIVFTLTKFLSMIAFVPGALGIFEGGMTLILISFGVSSHLALATTLLFRAFTFWLPMPIGWLLYRRYTRQGQPA